MFSSYFSTKNLHAIKGLDNPTNKAYLILCARNWVFSFCFFYNIFLGAGAEDFHMFWATLVNVLALILDSQAVACGWVFGYKPSFCL
jgi:hypothetical protein